MACWLWKITLGITFQEKRRVDEYLLRYKSTVQPTAVRQSSSHSTWKWVLMGTEAGTQAERGSQLAKIDLKGSQYTWGTYVYLICGPKVRKVVSVRGGGGPNTKAALPINRVKNWADIVQYYGWFCFVNFVSKRRKRRVGEESWCRSSGVQWLSSTHKILDSIPSTENQQTKVTWTCGHRHPDRLSESWEPLGLRNTPWEVGSDFWDVQDRSEKKAKGTALFPLGDSEPVRGSRDY